MKSIMLEGLPSIGWYNTLRNLKGMKIRGAWILTEAQVPTIVTPAVAAAGSLVLQMGSAVVFVLFFYTESKLSYRDSLCFSQKHMA